MATYEYECKACKHTWELVQSMKDDPIRSCPSCGKDEAQRLISNANFVLKGGNWTGGAVQPSYVGDLAETKKSMQATAEKAHSEYEANKKKTP